MKRECGGARPAAYCGLRRPVAAAGAHWSADQPTTFIEWSTSDSSGPYRTRLASTCGAKPSTIAATAASTSRISRTCSRRAGGRAGGGGRAAAVQAAKPHSKLPISGAGKAKVPKVFAGASAHGGEVSQHRVARAARNDADWKLQLWPTAPQHAVHCLVHSPVPCAPSAATPSVRPRATAWVTSNAGRGAGGGHSQTIEWAECMKCMHHARPCCKHMTVSMGLYAYGCQHMAVSTGL
eukprot:SAG11_NODE_1895_length_4093_cov_4.148473_3_plen_237_part_00